MHAGKQINQHKLCPLDTIGPRALNWAIPRKQLAIHERVSRGQRKVEPLPTCEQSIHMWDKEPSQSRSASGLGWAGVGVGRASGGGDVVEAAGGGLGGSSSTTLKSGAGAPEAVR